MNTEEFLRANRRKEFTSCEIQLKVEDPVDVVVQDLTNLISKGQVECSVKNHKFYYCWVGGRP